VVFHSAVAFASGASWFVTDPRPSRGFAVFLLWGHCGELTPQQRQIVRLASDGLTDREIGDRLFLSPRTVSSHLYRSFPKLGVASRHQLRDVITRASTPATAHESAGSRTLR
jgi:DNA-binding CsgD family transcriptional regulator